MTFSNYMLDMLKAANDGASDYAMAKMIGVSRQAISQVRNGRNGLGDPQLMKIADLLVMDRVETVARAHIQDDPCHNMRLLWSEILHRIDGVQPVEMTEEKTRGAA